MLETLADLVDPTLWRTSGRVFYSGRAAFSREKGLYVLGFNPGGDPNSPSEGTVEDHTTWLLREAPERWSAYVDEAWLDYPRGEAPLQRRLQHLTRRIGCDLRETPASNLIFQRSKRVVGLGTGSRELADRCWPVHAAVLKTLQPKAIVCLGRDTGERVRHRVGADKKIAAFVERNLRRWESAAWRGSQGPLVFSLTHPSIADWTSADTDPGAMVAEVLADLTA